MDYSDTLDFRRVWVRGAMFFVLEVPDYKSWMFIYLIFIDLINLVVAPKLHKVA